MLYKFEIPSYFVHFIQKYLRTPSHLFLKKGEIKLAAQVL